MFDEEFLALLSAFAFAFIIVAGFVTLLIIL